MLTVRSEIGPYRRPTARQEPKFLAQLTEQQAFGER